MTGKVGGGRSEEIWGGELYGSQGEQRWDQSWPTEYKWETKEN